MFKEWIQKIENSGEALAYFRQTPFGLGFGFGNVLVVENPIAESTKALVDYKTIQATENNVDVFYIYPWDAPRIPQICSHLESKLGMDCAKFAAKNLDLKVIDNKVADDFIKQHHIQGSANASRKISVALLEPGTGNILAVQQYGQSRWAVKKSPNNEPTVWEGLRLCFAPGTQIHGGATRLQKWFEEKFSVTELVSYIDFSHSVGTYKEMQGFEEQRPTYLAYMWVLKTAKSVPIIDKTGATRLPDMQKILATPFLNPNKIAGAFGKGVGQMFYGGKLGSRAELKPKNPDLYHNDLILEALGYRKMWTAGQKKWVKKIPQNLPA